MTLATQGGCWVPSHQPPGQGQRGLLSPRAHLPQDGSTQRITTSVWDTLGTWMGRESEARPNKLLLCGVASLGWGWPPRPTLRHQWHRSRPSLTPPPGPCWDISNCWGVGKGGRWRPNPGDPGSIVSQDFIYKTQLKDRIIKNFKMATTEH